MSAVVGASVTSVVAKSQQGSAAAELDVVDETLPPKPKCKFPIFMYYYYGSVDSYNRLSLQNYCKLGYIS